MGTGRIALVQTIAMTVAVTSLVWIGLAAAWIFELRGDDDIDRARGARVVTKAPAAVAARPPDELPMRRVRSHPAVLAIPVAGVRPDDLVDTWGQERDEGHRSHEAIDIMAPAGTAVLAAAPGEIEKLFESQTGGKTVYVRSDDRAWIYYYAHLESYAPGLAEGQRIASGDRLGVVGSTGNADETAPHLHFEMLMTQPDRAWYEAKEPVNPYPLLAGRRPIRSAGAVSDSSRSAP